VQPDRTRKAGPTPDLSIELSVGTPTKPAPSQPATSPDSLAVVVPIEPARSDRVSRSRLGADRRAPAPGWVADIGPEIAAAGIGGLVFGWAVARPSLWRDEAATMSVGRRSLNQIAEALHDTDLVHGGYYLFAHLALRLHDSVTSLRLVSVIAFALTAVVLVRIGRAIGSLGIGATAAALLVASPLASRYAQEARPFALVTLTATASTYALLRAVGSGAMGSDLLAGAGAGGRTRWLLYATSLVLLGLTNVLALLLVLSHGLVMLGMATGGGRRPAPLSWSSSSDGPRRLRTFDPAPLRRWATSVAGAGVLLSPFVLLSWSQRGQVAWISRPHLYDLTGVYVQAYQSRWPVLLAVVAALAVLVASRGFPTGPAGAAFVTGGVWATAAPLALWLVSQVKPLFDLHYVVFCLPGTTLFLASLPWALTARATDRPTATTRRSIGAVGLVALVAVLGLDQQAAYRDPQTGHVEDLRGVADYLHTHALPHDAVLFDEANLRVLVDVYPQDLRGLRNLGQARTPVESGTLFGVSFPPGQVAAVLAGAPRVWVVRGIPGEDPAAGSTEAEQRAELAGHYLERSHAEISTILLTLYVRTP
jgi:mannosyltransferase